MAVRRHGTEPRPGRPGEGRAEAGAKGRRAPGTAELRLRAALAEKEEELRLTRNELLTAEADALRAHAKLEEAGGGGPPDWTFRTPSGMVAVRFGGPGRPAGEGPGTTLARKPWNALFGYLARAARAEAERATKETNAGGGPAAEQGRAGGRRWQKEPEAGAGKS